MTSFYPKVEIGRSTRRTVDIDDFFFVHQWKNDEDFDDLLQSVNKEKVVKISVNYKIIVALLLLLFKYHPFQGNKLLYTSASLRLLTSLV